MPDGRTTMSRPPVSTLLRRARTARLRRRLVSRLPYRGDLLDREALVSGRNFDTNTMAGIASAAKLTITQARPTPACHTGNPSHAPIDDAFFRKAVDTVLHGIK